MARTRSTVACAIIDLRSSFEESQQRFSDRLGVSMITVARWEIDDRHPGARYLKDLWLLASEQRRADLARIFADAFAQVTGFGLADRLMRELAAIQREKRS